MKNLSNQNRTIIATVSSPPAGGYALFDVAVVLTSEGRLMYNSTAKDAVPYYIKAFGFAFDHTANPADFLLELSIEGGISKDALLVKPSDLVDHYFHTNPLLRSISINSVTSDEAKIHRYSSLSNSIYSNIGLKRISEIVTYRPISVRGFSKQIFPLLYRYSLLTYRNRTPIYLAFGR